MSKKQLSHSEIASFCSQTAMLFHAGIPPAESMSLLSQDAASPEGREIIQAILITCQKGEPFSQALAGCGVFPSYFIHMIRLGEESGNLDVVMQSLNDYYEREENISHSIRSAISYPCIMIGMMLLVIFVLVAKVLPIFNQVFIQLGSEMTGFSASLLKLGQALNRYSVFCIIFVGALIFLFILVRKTTTGRRLSAGFFSRFPLTRSFYEKTAAGRLAGGLALTLSSGMDTYMSLDMVSQLVEHKGMQQKIAACKASIQAGSGFAEALASSGIFSSLYSRMVAIGFRSGSIDSVMQKIADRYQKETDRRIEAMISALEPTLVIILSLIVGMILLSVILPLMGIMSSIG